MGKYIIQKATDWDKQASKFRAGRTLQDLAATHEAQRKYDGCHMLVRTFVERDRLGPVAWFHNQSRTGEDVLSCDHIGKAVLNHYGVGWVVQGEVWQPRTPFNESSGAFRRHSPQPDLLFVIYDVVRADAFAIGRDDRPYRERREMIHAKRGLFQGGPLRAVEVYNPGTYGDPLKLARSLADEKYNGGDHYDGLILRDLDAPWVREEAKQGELVKVKPEVSYDLRVKAVKQQVGEKTGRDTLQLIVNYKGRDLAVGSGISHADQASWLENPLLIIDKIVEVEAMCESAEGLLREPRCKGVRHDKVKADFE